MSEEEKKLFVIVQMKPSISVDGTPVSFGMSLSPWEAYTVEENVRGRCEALNRESEAHSPGISYQYQEVAVDKFVPQFFLVVFDVLRFEWRAEPASKNTIDYMNVEKVPTSSTASWQWLIKATARYDAIRIAQEYAVLYAIGAKKL